MTYKNRQADEGKARGKVALIIMYINIEHHILITLLTEKQTYRITDVVLNVGHRCKLFLKHQ